MPATLNRPNLADRKHPPALVYVVDDESIIGSVVQLLLTKEGYRVEYFENPCRAYEAFVDASDRPALLLSDYVMEPINGLELIQHCKAVCPRLRTVLYSGNIGQAITGAIAIRPDAFLQKPFLARELMELIEKVLNLEPVPG